MESPAMMRTVHSEILADQLEKPLLDNRIYKVIRLPNKLEALLIHDPDTDKASAALDVNAGAFSDAEDMPGMAHAVEHLLFMGTKKFPVENAYSQYLTSHSGYSNAYTASTSTNYFFELAAQSAADDKSTDSVSPLYGALDRFAQFFIEPLFLEETLDRELRAVDSENKKNLQSDTWRLHQLGRTLANPEHPYHKFSTGNLEVLRDEPVARGVQIRKEFIKFHTDNYSANRMKLVVLGRESLVQLQEWVEELFAEVVNKDLPQNRWDGIMPYTQAELMTQTFAKPVMETRSLDIDFVSEDEELLYETQPSHYLSHLIGHEGPGSVLAYLKEKGWANGLSSGGYDLCPGSGLFHVSIKLTPEGLKHYKEVTTTVFQYISILQETGPQQWIFEEMKGMSEVNFRFKQKSPVSRTTSGLSASMQKPLPREWLLSGNVVRKYDAEAISKTLSYLQPDNCRLTIVAQELDELKEGVKQEKWYGTEYKIEKLPQDFQDDIKKAASATKEQRPAELHLPAKNEFIPTRLEVEKKEIAEPSKAPTLIRNEQNVRLWYKKDDQFWVPKANFNVYLRNPTTKSSARNAAIAQLYADLVQDSLTEYSYDAEIAGLSYSLYAGSGFLIDVGGYNDKMAVLLEKVLVSLRDLDIKTERFEIIKERTIRGHRNSEFGSPYQQVGKYSAWLAKDKGYITDDYLAEFPSITVDDLRHFKSVLLSQLHIEGLAHGNIYREDALKLIDLTERILKPKNLPVSQWPIRRSLMLPENSHYVYARTLKDPSNVNHCIDYICQVGTLQDRRLFAQLRLFSQMTDEPAFDQLRSKEQLGYVVFRGITQQETAMGFRVLIQSERTCEYLEQRIDSFLTNYKKTLVDMSDEDFESHRRSVINKRLEKLKNLDSETNRFWSHITNEVYHFEQVDDDVAHLRALNKSDIVAFYDRYIDPASTQRSKLSVHLVAQKSSPKADGDAVEVSTEAAVEDKPAVKIEDVHAFKASLAVSPGATAFKDISNYEDLESKL